MKKTLIEQFIEKHDLIMEAEFKTAHVKVALYEKGDLYIEMFTAKTYVEAINKAVNNYLEVLSGNKSKRY